MIEGRVRVRENGCLFGQQILQAENRASCANIKLGSIRFCKQTIRLLVRAVRLVSNARCRKNSTE